MTKEHQRVVRSVSVIAMRPANARRGRNRMTQGSVPLSIPRDLGNTISMVLERFATSTKLQHEVWYHNEPRWIVWQEADDGVVREVQIAAFSGKSDDELCFIPHAYAFANDQLRATEEKVTRPKILRLSLPALQSFVGNVGDKIEEQLRTAWARANEFEDSNLVLVKKK